MKTILNFINYWYFRYLLVTELYMVEKWERVMFHIVVFILLSIISLFNTAIVLGLVSSITASFLGDPLIENHLGINNEL